MATKRYVKIYYLGIRDSFKVKWYLWRKNIKKVHHLLAKRILMKENFSHYLKIKRGDCDLFVLGDIIVRLKYHIDGTSVIIVIIFILHKFWWLGFFSYLF